jgi:hypothetical protein
MKKKNITRLHIFYKRYLAHSLIFAIISLFLILFTLIVASIGYADNFNYDSQWFIRQTKYILLLPIIIIVLSVVSKFTYTKRESNILSIFNKSYYGKYYIIASILSIIFIISTFHLSRVFIYKVLTNDQIEKLILYSIITLFSVFILIIILVILYARPIKLSNEYRRPLLILRSFSDISYNNFVSYEGKDEIYKSLMRTIAQRFTSFFPTIIYDNTLSEFSKINQFGSVTFSEPDNWLRKVEQIANHSVAIIIIPLATEGVITEINMLIKKRFINKVYFLMPPENAMYLSKKEVESYWEHNRVEFLKADITLPKFKPDGVLFNLNEDFTLNNEINLNYSINNVIKLQKKIKKEDLNSNFSLERIVKNY